MLALNTNQLINTIVVTNIISNSHRLVLIYAKLSSNSGTDWRHDIGKG